MSAGWPEPPVAVQRVFPSHQAQLAVLRLGTTEIRQHGVLFTDGERARSLFILLRGEIRLSATAAHFLSDANPGDCIGLLSVIKGTYAMRAENTSIVVLRVIPRSALLQVITANEDVRSGMQRYIDAFGERVGEPLQLPPIVQSHGVAGR
ncbi:MAG: cyclic nucleotide-binding domain-containing protein [Thermoanaerobaculia bacterium]